MSDTFTNVSKSSATNYLFLFAQRTLALQYTSPTPPPLNVLCLPFKVMRMFWDLSGMYCNGETSGWDVLVHLFGMDPHPIAHQPAPDETASGATPAAFNFAENISRIWLRNPTPLAKKITGYILDHQDVAAQEKRSRTALKRDMGKSFRKVKEEMQSMQKRSEQLHSKVDKKLDRIVKDLGRLTAV